MRFYLKLLLIVVSVVFISCEDDVILAEPSSSAGGGSYGKLKINPGPEDKPSDTYDRENKEIY